jgi:hypothetical protein
MERESGAVIAAALRGRGREGDALMHTLPDLSQFVNSARRNIGTVSTKPIPVNLGISNSGGCGIVFCSGLQLFSRVFPIILRHADISSVSIADIHFLRNSFESEQIKSLQIRKNGYLVMLNNLVEPRRHLVRIQNMDVFTCNLSVYPGKGGLVNPPTCRSLVVKK